MHPSPLDWNGMTRYLCLVMENLFSVDKILIMILQIHRSFFIISGITIKSVRYSTKKKLRKMCSSAYCNKFSKKLEIQTLVHYKVSFCLSNEASFELVASAMAEENNVKVD